MKMAELKKMKVGDELYHRRYGLCEIKNMSDPSFGVVVHIKTPEGQSILHHDCGADINDLMEDSIRTLYK